MIIYIANRNDGKVVYSTSTVLPNKKNILSDEMSDDIETGVRTMTVQMQDDSEDLKDILITGNYMLVYSSNDVTGDAQYEMYTIIEVTRKAEDLSYEIYGEDVGLELLNYSVGGYTNSAAVTLVQALGAQFDISSPTSSGWTWNNWTVTISSDANNTGTRQKETFNDSGEETLTSRLLTILSSFECEMYFEYEIDGLNVIKRYIRIVKARGTSDSSNPKYTFYMNKDLSNVTRKSNIENLATRYKLYGKDSSGNDVKFSKISNYSKYKGQTISPSSSLASAKRTHTYKIDGEYLVCTSVLSKWASKWGDSNGYLTQSKYTEYTDAGSLVNYAIRELEKVVDGEDTYEIEFREIHYEIRVGDYIKIVDERDSTYFQSRVTSLKRSELNNALTVEIGNYTLLTSSKAETVSTSVVDSPISLNITSRSGYIIKDKTISTRLAVAIYAKGVVITNKARLVEVFGDGCFLKWKDSNGTEIDSSDSRISDDGFIFTLDGVTDDKVTYYCALNDGKEN